MSEGKSPGAFAPLRNRVFAVLWVATVVGNIGGWMRDTASAWAMTELAPSPVMVALVQAAATLPIFLFSLPAGALADIVDRRRMMIMVQAGLAAVSLSLGLAALTGFLTPPLLLALTLVAGIGAALAGPVWQSIVPELVPRPDFKPAVALNSLGINIARAIGPALGGAIIVGLGVAAAYLIDVATYAVTIAALVWWNRMPSQAALPEHLGGAMHAGMRYTLASAPLRRVLLRAVIFFAPASCYWALLPLVARSEIGGGAAGYGILLAAVGVGAIGGALLMPRLRARLSGERVTLLATLATAACTAALAFVHSVAAGAAVLAVAGAAWIMVLTMLNATAQAVLPNWVRGRGLAVYLTVFFGTMTVGSLLWGQVAEATSLDAALLVAGGVGAASALAGRALVLPSGDEDLSPSHHWPEPTVVDGTAPAGGPIMVMIEYRVFLERQPAFADAMHDLGTIRRRDGAYEWGLMADAAEPERVTEWFLVASWEEHLRQHERVSVADRALQDRVRAFHAADAAPLVRHLVPLGSATSAAAVEHMSHVDSEDAT
ncbi:MAG TPA: MFS transporter [Microvirga sp.]|jgi:MFS family permease|nr:MFS transporter [Microvirga sp.]